MKINLLILFFLILSINLSSSQDNAITGIVTSLEDQEPLAYVAINLKGTNKNFTTDLDGKYSISNINSTDVLIFSYIGYKSEEIVVGDKTIINVSLRSDAKILDEVVVTALSIKRQKREIGYSTQKIETKTILQSNTPNIVSAMTGRAAGLVVSNGDGIDGGSTRITIRGNNNISGRNQPLIVVDGVQMENTPGLTDIGRGQDWGSPINNINSQDIEDINVLKGGAASALYGSRGANGVILITTKKGKKQKGLGISYNVTFKMKNPYRYREVQNKYGHGGPISFTPPSFPTNEAGDTLLYPGIYSNDQLVIDQEGNTSSSTQEFGYYGGAVSWGPKMDGQMVKWWDGKMREYSAQPNNLKSFFNSGFSTTHNLVASGGNEKGTIRLSFTRTDHTPIIENSNFDQSTFNLGSSLNISEKVKVSVSSTYVNYNRLNSPILGEDGNSFSKGSLYSWARSYKGLDKTNFEFENGAQNPQDGYPFSYVDPNLWWNYYNKNTKLNRNKFFGSLGLNYTITPWLDFTGSAGMDFTLSQFETRHKPIDLLGIEEGFYSNNLIKNNSSNLDFIFTAHKASIFNSKFDIKFSAGGARSDINLYQITGSSGDWYYPNMYTFFNYTPYEIDENNQVVETGSYPNLGENISKRRTNSLYSFIDLGFKNYLFMQISGRNDWSSTLPKDNNSFFYPSLSLSFILTEVLNINKSYINFWKIRLGAAQTATDADPYKTQFYYNSSLYAGSQSMSLQEPIPPYSLKPQRVNSYEIGTTMSLFDSKIDFDFTYYYLYSFDQIINSPLPVSSGASSLTINDGILTNKGIELILNFVPIQKHNLLLKSGFNFSRNRNKVVSLGDHAEVLLMADIWGLNGPAMALSEGDDFGTIIGYDHIYHENGQPVVNEAGTKYEITDTRVPIGNASPDFIAGWNTLFTYKNLSISTLIDTKWGGDIYSGSYVIGLQTGQSPETLIEREGGGLPYTDPNGDTRNIGIILDGVYENGQQNEKVVHYYYKYLPNAGGWGKFLSKPGILHNTWVKFRELSINYRFPKNLIQKIKVFKDLNLSIVGRDLFYIYSSLPDKINPEGIMGSGNAQGFEWASYPSSRSITIGINAKF